jgi:hypothetical protein
MKMDSNNEIENKEEISTEIVESKPNKMIKVKSFVSQLVITTVKLLKITIYLSLILAAFIVGARMHEVGFLAGHFQKTLKGATVNITGSCYSPTREKLLGVNGQVVVINISSTEIMGLLRGTTDIIKCKTNEFTVETLPLFSDLFKNHSDLQKIPAMDASPVKEIANEYKALENKDLIISGTCVSIDNQALPTFTDEVVAVTEIALSKDDPKQFELAGIKKSDKSVIKCIKGAIHYRLADAKDLAPKEAPPVVKEEKISFVNSMQLVTGLCYPHTKKGSPFKDITLKNSQVKILEEKLDESGKQLKFLVGSLFVTCPKENLNCKEKKFDGVIVDCDKSKSSFVHEAYNEDEQKLEPPQDEAVINKDKKIEKVEEVKQQL